MKQIAALLCGIVFQLASAPLPLLGAPTIDPIPSASIPAGKSLIIPVTATSPNGRALTFSATSSTNRITVQVHTNNPFWKMSVVQAASPSAPGAYQTPFRGGVETVTNIGVIMTNSLGRKEVRGSHTYTNSGDYPVYVTIQSTLGASSTAVCTSTVPPSLSLARVGTNNSLSWPAWAFAYQPLSNTNFTGTNWVAMTNLSTLVAYQNIVTNGTGNSNLFFRLRK